MKKCEKGFTLLELLICVTMVSVVVVFLFKILNNVQSEEKNNGYVKANQVNRNRIMKEVGLELNKRKICYADYDGSEYVTFEFCGDDNSSLELGVTSSKIKVHLNDNSTGNYFNKDYNMKDQAAIYGTPTVSTTKFNGADYRTIRIPVSKKGLKKSTLDDLEFTFRYYSDN